MTFLNIIGVILSITLFSCYGYKFKKEGGKVNLFLCLAWMFILGVDIFKLFI